METEEQLVKLRRKNKKLRQRIAELEPYEPRTKGFSVGEDGNPIVDVHFPESFAQLMLANFRWYLDEHEAPNYVQMPMTDMTTGEKYVCTIGRPGGKSPHEMRLLAEARVAQLEAEIQDAWTSHLPDEVLSNLAEVTGIAAWNYGELSASQEKTITRVNNALAAELLIRPAPAE